MGLGGRVQGGPGHYPQKGILDSIKSPKQLDDTQLLASYGLFNITMHDVPRDPTTYTQSFIPKRTDAYLQL